MGATGADDQRHRRHHDGRTEIAEKGEHVAAREQTPCRQHGLLRVVAAVFDGDLQLPTMDAAPLVFLVEPHHDAVADRCTEDRDRPGQVLNRRHPDALLIDARRRSVGHRRQQSAGQHQTHA